MSDRSRRVPQLSRRSLLLGLGALPLAGCVAVSPPESESTAGIVPPTAPPVHGTTQAGIVDPTTPQAHVRVAVFDGPPADQSREFLAGLGSEITHVIAAVRRDSTRDFTTVLVGISDSWARVLWGMPGAVDPLPSFARDAIPSTESGGDLILQIASAEAWILVHVAQRLSSWIQTHGGKPRWAQDGSRDVIPGAGYSRNLTGFHDGIINPRTKEEHSRGVWSENPAGTCVLVVRRLSIDLDAFLSLSTTAQERLVGREKASGAPLSGGTITDEVNLFAKDDAGNYLVPAGAHAREAHPSAMGEALMLRRGYAYSRGSERGHLFISFQRDVALFTKTQQHLDTADSFMKHVSCTGSGVFRVLPGFSESSPLGAL